MIEALSLTKRFAEIEAVRDVSFTARPGEILGVLGPNGAGKTTTLRLLCGFLPPSAGAARVDGFDVVADSLNARRRIGYLPETNPLHPEMRVVEYLRFRAGIKGLPRRRRDARLAAVVEQCGLTEVARQTIGTLSTGFRQRVGLADALVADPTVLVLDEPTSNLDPLQVVELRQLIRGLRDRRTILFSSHQLHEVEQLADRVVIFRRGRVIAEDSTDALRRQTRARATVTIELSGEARERLPALTDQLAIVIAVEDLDQGWLRVTLEADADPRVGLFERAGQLGLTLRELTRRQLSLEEVFQQLTAAADGVDASAPPAAARIQQEGQP